MTYTSVNTTTYFFITVILLLLAYLILERIILYFQLKQFPIRIHVNGTRGKSSITRLIRAGLTSSGFSVFAKTTGTQARMIFPDHSEHPIYRWGRPSIVEQISILKKAKEENANALVIECMALEPRYQWASEGMILKSSIGVITNIREDHLDIMGPTLYDVTLSLASAIPVNGKLILHPTKYMEVIRKACKERNTEILVVEDSNAIQITDEDMQKFPYWEHKENVILALAVCKELGIAKEKALAAMWTSTPDPGALSPVEISFFGKQIVYINAMAANDTESTLTIWNQCIQRYGKNRSAYILFNCRDDRMDRSKLMAHEISKWDHVESIFLIGSGTKIALQILKSKCRVGTKLYNWENADVDSIFESIISQIQENSYIIGIGNIAGIGLELNQYLKNRTTFS